jgi:hypothetical protein
MMGHPDVAPQTVPIAEVTQESLLAAGAEPTHPDVAALVAQITALQQRVDDMAKAQGVPADPLAAAVKNLTDHVMARAGAMPQHDMAELLATLKELGDDPDTDKTSLLRVLVDELPRTMEGREYLSELASSLHKAALKR